jgi:hypothetical protein
VLQGKEFQLLDSAFFDSDHFVNAKLRQKGLYCAPEVYNQISTPLTEPLVQNLFKCDLFSLGLTVLEVVLPKCERRSSCS